MFLGNLFKLKCDQEELGFTLERQIGIGSDWELCFRFHPKGRTVKSKAAPSSLPGRARSRLRASAQSQWDMCLANPPPNADQVECRFSCCA